MCRGKGVTLLPPHATEGECRPMSRRLTVLATATVMATVAMLAMAGLAWAQQQEEEPQATTTTTATEETTATGEDTTTAEQDSSSSTAAPLVAPTASKNLKIE